MEDATYYIRFRGEVQGPFTRDQLLAKKRAGQLSVVHNISTDQDNWTMAKNMDWLFPPPEPIRAPEPPLNPTRINETPLAPPPSPHRRSPLMIVAAAFVLTCILGAGILVVLKRPHMPASPSETSVGPFDRARIDGHVCLVVQQRVQSIAWDNGQKMDVVYPKAHGSGFVVSRDGYILTNRHVVVDVDEAGHQLPLPPRGNTVQLFRPMLPKDAKPEAVLSNATVYERPSKISVRFNTNEWMDAQIVFVAQDRDVAVLKVDRQFPDPFTVADHFERGERVTAFGFPGASQMFARDMNREEFDKNLQTKTYDFLTTFKVSPSDWYNPSQVVLNQTSGDISAIIDSTDLTSGGILLQTNTFIRHGNSGGPLLDNDGKVVGIVTLGGRAAAELARDTSTNKIVVQLDMDGEGLNSAFSLKEMVPMLIHKTNGRVTLGQPVGQ